jgi:hypothetical protein
MYRHRGHAWVVQVNFDPDVIPFDETLGRFFAIHDSTTLVVAAKVIGHTTLTLGPVAGTISPKCSALDVCPDETESPFVLE